VLNPRRAEREFDVFAKDKGKWTFQKRIEARNVEEARQNFYEETRAYPMAWITAYPR